MDWEGAAACLCATLSARSNNGTDRFGIHKFPFLGPWQAIAAGASEKIVAMSDASFGPASLAPDWREIPGLVGLGGRYCPAMSAGAVVNARLVRGSMHAIVGRDAKQTTIWRTITVHRLWHAICKAMSASR